MTLRPREVALASLALVAFVAPAAQARVRDVDGDRLSNRFELRQSHTDPRSPDTDGDRLTDGFEWRRSHTSPRRKDTDRDGYSDGLEVRRGTNPLRADRRKPKPPPLPSPDVAAPETTITSGPTGTVTSASASFAFSSSEANSSFQCRMDSGAWAGCSSPRAYSGLPNGSHEFDVRATDAASNVDASPASRTWSVAVVAPPLPPPPPSPSAFPTPATTGVAAGWTPVTTTNGDLTVTQAGAVIDRRLVTGSINIRAENVTVRNSRVYGNIYNQANGHVYSGLLVEDVEIGPDSGNNGATVGSLGSAGYTARRVHIHNSTEGFRVGGYGYSGGQAGPVVIEDSFVDLDSRSGSCDHADGVQEFDGPPLLVIRHNTIDMRGVDCSTAPIYLGDSPGSKTVTGNLIMGGSYTLRLHNGASGISYPEVTGNRLVNNAWDYGPVLVDSCAVVGSWADNRLATIDSDYNVTLLGSLLTRC